MTFRCSQCGKTSETSASVDGDIECPHCGTKLQSPTMLEKAKPASNPMVLPILMGTSDTPELAQEKVKDLQETRKQRGEDRASNGIGALGFALGLATLLFLFSAAAVRKEMPIYLVFASCISVPASLFALVFSVLGVLRRGRSKIFSLLGVLIAGFLVVAAIPAAFLALRHGN